MINATWSKALVKSTWTAVVASLFERDPWLPELQETLASPSESAANPDYRLLRAKSG